MMRRAYLPEEKETRRKAILAGAVQLFREVPYPELRMVDLARRLGLGKGTLYLYFPTKEALFLAVLQAEMGAWFAATAGRLRAMDPGADPRQVAGELVEEILARPLLPKLQAILHNVLEENVPPKEAVAFARFLEDGVASVGRLLEAVLSGLPAGHGASYLIRFHALVMGNHLMSSRPPVVRETLREPGLGIFDFDFPAVMAGSAVDLLRGMLAGTACAEAPSAVGDGKDGIPAANRA